MWQQRLLADKQQKIDSYCLKQKFIKNGIMQNTISKIEELSSTLNKALPMEAEFQSKLDKKFRLEFNYNSNHIEGNTLTYGETELLLIFDKTTGNHELREYEEMKAHDIAFEFIKEWSNDKERPLTETAIKNLHKVLLVRPFWKEASTPDNQSTRKLITVGSYKKELNHVRLQNGEMFHFASPQDTPIKMGELIQWYREQEEKKEFHPVVLAALLHYKFVCIHPFDDGNGRMSRLLMNYVLLKHNLPPVVIKSVEKKNYLFALNQADVGDENAFIRYIAEQLIWSLKLSIKAAKGESIEEPDDVEKEISIWKKQAAQNYINKPHRNDNLVYEIYTNGVKEMLQQLEYKYKKHFYDLFKKSIFLIRIIPDYRGEGDIQWLSDEIDKIVVKPPQKSANADETSKSVISHDTFTDIVITIDFNEYKYENPFTIRRQLLLGFNQYKYEVIYGRTKKIEKLYNEFLNGYEWEQIIADELKAVFEEIKEKSGNGKH